MQALHTSGSFFTTLLLVLSGTLFLVALVDSVRKGSIGWVLAILLLPGLGALAWLAIRFSKPREL